MKLIRLGRQKLKFEIGEEEKELLFQVLLFYPLVPATHHRLNQDRRIPDPNGNQQLLESALRDQQQENRALLAKLLKQPRRFTQSEGGYYVSFSRPEVEWLLQVLNDVRVGSWLALGSPLHQLEIQKGMSKPKAQKILAMDIAGYFQMAFLQALQKYSPTMND